LPLFVLVLKKTNILPRETFVFVGKQTAACIPIGHEKKHIVDLA
jgi:hypothetical protein